MKIVVIGGTGLIGKKLVNKLKERGHTVVAASRSSGINTLTDDGLSDMYRLFNAVTNPKGKFSE